MKNGYIIGVDGGGTKTTAVLSDFNGRIFKKIKGASSNPNKIGQNKAILNLKNLIFALIKGYPKEKISLAYFGLAGGLERDKIKREKIKKDLKKYFDFPIIVESDQKIAFRANTDSNDGVLIIAGTGSVSIGWRKGKEAISGGWDWLLGDQGSAFWIGKNALENSLKFFDCREKNFSELQKIIFKKFKIKSEKDLYQKFYNQNFVEKIASISKIVDSLAILGDKDALKILEKAGKELSKMGNSVIKKLSFQREKFPLVLSGSVFKSKIVLNIVKKEIKKNTPRVEFIQSKNEPIKGAIKMAISLNNQRVLF